MILLSKLKSLILDTRTMFTQTLLSYNHSPLKQIISVVIKLIIFNNATVDNDWSTAHRKITYGPLFNFHELSFLG